MPSVRDSFSWRDGERLIRFGAGVAGEAPGLLVQHGFSGYVLLTTPRAEAALPAVATDAWTTVQVPPGRVDELSAELLPEAGDRPLVALGGGRVIDTAKAIAGVRGGPCAALPTTLSGAELTPFHRTPKGVAGARLVRPSLVLADPALMASQPPQALAASAMNALAHAMESLYTPYAHPVAELAALRGAELLALGVSAEPPGRDELALGALLAGYASASTGIAVHHATCQTIVRTAGSPHAETNAVMLPHFARLMAPRAPRELGELAAALGDRHRDPLEASTRVAELARRSGHTRLSTIGVEEDQLAPIASAVLQHPTLANTPSPPTESELLALLREAL
jgi:alcohol dehydrogenase class IV